MEDNNNMTQDDLYKKFDEFFAQKNGKQVETVDPNALYQCFDLVVAWTDYIGIPRVLGFLNAYQIYTDFGPTQAQYFDRIPNTPEFVPKKGDILVWSQGVGPNGHTAVAKGIGDTAHFDSFDQNWSGMRYSTTVKHNYSWFLGCLRPKTQAATEDKRYYYFDLIWHKRYPDTDTRKVTQQQVEEFIKTL